MLLATFLRYNNYTINSIYNQSFSILHYQFSIFHHSLLWQDLEVPYVPCYICIACVSHGLRRAARRASPAALRSGSLRADCRQCGKRCAPVHPARAERLVSCTHAHGPRLGSENRHCAVLLPSGFVKISSNQLIFWQTRCIFINSTHFYWWFCIFTCVA